MGKARAPLKGVGVPLKGMQSHIGVILGYISGLGPCLKAHGAQYVLTGLL